MFRFFQSNKKNNISLSQLDLEHGLTFRELFKKFDTFYICFDEPNRKNNWKSIKTTLPRARKTEGVVGFDQALKACARKSKTKHFFVIDGDNSIIQSKLDEQVKVEKVKDNWVLSFSAFNPLNGLAYGNGGLKLWPKDVALTIETHENSSGKGDRTDYCFVAQYYMVDQYVTETIVTNTPRQAFRAGLREGVKMSLAWGEQVHIDHSNFESTLGRQNRLRLTTWCEVGADVTNGYWAILGARFGLKLNLIDRFDCTQINSYHWIDQFMDSNVVKPLNINMSRVPNVDDRLIPLIQSLGAELNSYFPLDLKVLRPEESKLVKRKINNPPRAGLLRHESNHQV